MALKFDVSYVRPPSGAGMIPGTSPPAVPRLLCWQRIVNMDDHVWPLVSKAFLSLVGQNSFWVNTEIPGAISLLCA